MEFTNGLLVKRNGLFAIPNFRITRSDDILISGGRSHHLESMNDLTLLGYPLLKFVDFNPVRLRPSTESSVALG
jgi:hypothetical protein